MFLENFFLGGTTGMQALFLKCVSLQGRAPYRRILWQTTKGVAKKAAKIKIKDHSSSVSVAAAPVLARKKKLHVIRGVPAASVAAIANILALAFKASFHSPFFYLNFLFLLSFPLQPIIYFLPYPNPLCSVYPRLSKLYRPPVLHG